MPKLEKVNPAVNAKNIFSMKSVVNVGLMVLKSIVIGAGIAIIFYIYLGDAIRMVLGGLGAALTVTKNASVALTIWAVAGMLILASLDFAYKRFQFLKDMRMSMREIRREIKEDQGDPIIKSARKKQGKQPSVASQLEYVDRSTLILEDGDGKVLALFYRPDVQPKPVVVARVGGAYANKAKEIAFRAQVPFALDSNLSRRLWPLASPSHTVPDQFVDETIDLIQKFKRS